ncbi:MAG: hypothetical protein HY243_12205 [Proteobacteria bacterium]|nr:hypothetical protein [Pseudomonadota bacterium]
MPNKQVAEAIYRAIGHAFAPEKFEEYPLVIVEDEGDHWSVGQVSGQPPPHPSPGTVIVSAGGGQLVMDINKCTGAISNAGFNR